MQGVRVERKPVNQKQIPLINREATTRSIDGSSKVGGKGMMHALKIQGFSKRREIIRLNWK